MPLGNVHKDHARLPGRQFTTRMVEAEICLKLGHDLEVRDTPFTGAEVLAAVESCHPAIEILQSRFTDSDAQDRLSQLGDFISHGAFVYGTANDENWRDTD